jgi:[protein-PII] uridylyltransferase
MLRRPQNGLRANIVAGREKLASEREKLKAQHRSGSAGIQVCTRFSDVMDDIIRELFETGLSDLHPAPHDPVRNRVAVVLHGGYGRKEMAPYSDVDLMLLHDGSSEGDMGRLAGRLLQDICDIGLDPGFALRSWRQAVRLSLRDPIILTSLIESRFLAGSERLFARFLHTFERQVRGRASQLVRKIELARRAERLKYGENIHLLEPNVKRSRGGLRDIQLLRWIGFLHYGQANPDFLKRGGHLAEADYRDIRHAQDYLLRLRNELHFHAGNSHDTLDRGEQVRIAEQFGYTGSEGISPVENFMRDYFQHTETVRHCVAHFVDGAQWRLPILKAVINTCSRQTIDGDFHVGPLYISATRQGLEKVTSSVADVLRLMDLSNWYDRRIDYPTWEAMRAATFSHDEWPVDDRAVAKFRSLLSQPNRLGSLLRRLHELRVLEKLIPGFAHARFLLQFNEYHRYTVDEHSIRAVQCATEFANHKSVVADAYRQIKDKTILHLALLIHDLGKGFVEDHSEVGARLALDVAHRLRLSPEETETLRFLVHRHLMLAHLAFRRNTSDEALVLRHAAEIGSPSMLRMLFVLTCADLAAVGPDVLNDWKLQVLSDLYLRLMDKISGDSAPVDSSLRLAQLQRKLSQQLPGKRKNEWLEHQIRHLPLAYLEGPTSHLIVEDLMRIQGITPESVIAWGRYLPERTASEYSVCAYESKAPGVFHRLAGALTSQGLQILSAEIHNLADGLFLDRFYVRDDDFRDQPPPSRIESVNSELIRALSTLEPPVFRKKWIPHAHNSRSLVNDRPTRVQVDNSTSDTSTVIDIFTHDKPGLLYTITRTLFELDLSVQHAKIGTYLDQVVDVFYVTDLVNRKIRDDKRLRQIRERLLGEIEAFAQVDSA